MVRIYKWFRAIVMVTIALAILLPAAVYLVLSSDLAMSKLKVVGQEELSKLLGTEVVIGEVHVQPFNRVVVSDVTVADDYGKQCLKAGRVEARFEFWHFLTTGHIVFDYATLDNVDLRLYKESKDSPLNVAQILENLKSKDENKPPTRFDLAVYTVHLNNVSLRYDVLDQPVKDSQFDVNHIYLSNLSLNATAPVISNDLIGADLRHLSFNMLAGFALTNLTANVRYTPTSLSVENLNIDLPESHLALGTYNFTYDNPDALGRFFKEIPLTVRVNKGSYVTVSDAAFFVPRLSGIDRRFNLSADVTASQSEINLRSLHIDEVTDGGFIFDGKADVVSPLLKDSLRVKDLSATVRAYPLSVLDMMDRFEVRIPVDTRRIIERLGCTDITAKVSGTINELEGDVEVNTQLGAVALNAVVAASDGFRNIDFDGTARVTNLNLGKLLNNGDLGVLSTTIEGSVSKIYGKQLPVADVTLSDTRFAFKGRELHDFDASFNILTDGAFEGRLQAAVDRAELLADVHGTANKQYPRLAGTLSVVHFNPHELGLTDKYPGYDLDVDVALDLAGEQGDRINGFVDVSNLNFRSGNPEQPALLVNNINLTADNTVRPNEITVTSDYLNGTIQGNFSLQTIVGQIRDIIASVLPAVVTPPKGGTVSSSNRRNDFHFDFTLNNVEPLINFFKLPVNVIYPVSISGRMNYDEKDLALGIDAPYLMKGDMIIEQTTVQTRFNADKGVGDVYLTTQFPTKKGLMVIAGGLHAAADKINTTLDWEIERAKPIKGQLVFDTRLSRDVDNGKICATVDFVPCQIQFGNDTWRMSPSTVTYRPGILEVDNFQLATQTQSLKIDGVCEAGHPEKEIKIRLKDVVLNTIFETLDINKALIGGIATGTLHGGGLFDGTPFVTSEDLHVENIGYNNCVLGTGDIVAKWDNDKKSFNLAAVIHQEDGRTSYINGDIFPLTESLDITFDADHIKVGFMRPFMEAFAADVNGYASGHARIFGNFKYIDMEGDIYAQDLGLKVAFTNTWYYATDSLHIIPGLIDIKNVRVKDVDGNTAMLNGFVKHNFFKDPVFDFKVTEAKHFLSYDVTPAISPDWYGKIYGNGSAFINGSPGVVNIDVNMTTSDGSTFTFVLSDMEEAEQYNFITFRDKNRDIITDSIIQADILPPEVIAYRDRILRQAQNQNPDAVYNMDIQMDITPAAKVIIVMDPVGGDEIKSWGNGHMRMTYTSVGNDLRMYGTYAIDRGSYNFTLQDIIVKDFIIKEGSSITFTGDPYNANLDITASYAVNANLSDLDESFLNDPELNRTNVPVHALLLVRGDMRQPDIDFDLEFPTLSSDIYRKVKSIISTDEMMNRQIIYLLALNRFYTPEYMSATKGKELFSVASSTISSRLSSMLGKLSENWTISPNLRSDKGDFSDVQFDLALSSNLLNNRLRLNGNFGYRDKSLNTTQFIGDFDLEYLLNRTGTWRLKAYNRFNDQTYFLRTAKTTQGVGIMFQREFDNLFGIGSKPRQTPTTPNPTPPVPNPSPGSPPGSTPSTPNPTPDSTSPNRTPGPIPSIPNPTSPSRTPSPNPTPSDPNPTPPTTKSSSDSTSTTYPTKTPPSPSQP